jgi:TetR/AcrR family transcriptional regulator, cholesterol catabolism regulator
MYWGCLLAMGVRQAQKQETRSRVLSAARDLFNEVGYEGATIRLVAQRAGVSVGSVFTTFSSKADILSQVMLERVGALTAEVEGLMAGVGGTVRHRFKAFLAANYRVEIRRPKLYLAHIIAAFTPHLEEGVVTFGATPQTASIGYALLREGIANGEIRPETDLDAFIDLVCAAYAWNYRLAARDAVAVEGLIALMDQQIDTLFDGIAKR